MLILNLAILLNSSISSIDLFLDAVVILCVDNYIIANNDSFVSFLLMLDFYFFLVLLNWAVSSIILNGTGDKWDLSLSLIWRRFQGYI